MHPAWHRYQNEPEVLYGLVIELHREIERGVIDAQWCRDEIADITLYLELEAAR